IEVSDDAQTWRKFADMSDNTADNPHKLIVSDRPVNARYVRITNSADLPCKFSIMDLRVFGKDDREKLADVTGFKAVRNESDRRVYDFEWAPVKDADGYILRWGTKEGDPSHSVMVRDTKYHAGYFHRDSEYFFTIEAF
ncbi:MAG: discoidin domain-containing protein, partial [Duncaniella sp.]|nr:discoidin domain-containing protein [Duncaniella sp.]